METTIDLPLRTTKYKGQLLRSGKIGCRLDLDLELNMNSGWIHKNNDRGVHRLVWVRFVPNP